MSHKMHDTENMHTVLGVLQQKIISLTSVRSCLRTKQSANAAITLVNVFFLISFYEILQLNHVKASV